MVPGRSLAALLQAQRAAGAFGPEPEAAARLAALVGLDRSRPHEYRRDMPDGSILEVRSAPTAEGGFVITQTDITALARAEAAARERANVLQAMLDNMRHGIVVFGPDHRVLAANDLCSTLAGMVPGTVRPGRGLAELVAARVAANGPFEPAAAAAAIAEDLGLDRGQPHRRERLNAHGRMVSVASDPLPDGGFVISYVDTTEVNAAKAQAQHRALLLQTMQDSMRHGIALFGPDQRLIVANRLAPDLSGLPAAEMVPGITPHDLAMWQLRHGVFGQGPDAEAEALAVAQRDRSRSHPVRRHMPDGRVVDSVSDPTPDGGFVITWTDVTAQVAAEAAAAERTATLQAMIDTMHHGVVLFGPDHRFIADNRLSRELAGVPDAAARPGASLESITAALFRAGATGDPALDERLAEMSRRADRSRPLHYTRPMRDGRTLEVFSDPMPDGGFVITLSDITPLARAEAEAKRRAATQAVMLDVIRHGIALFGPDRRLVAANRLASELSGVPADYLHAGMLFEDVVHHQHETGVFGPGEAGAAIRDRALGADRSRMLRYHRRAPDGRLIEVVSDPTADGGFAITYSDITALAAAEAERRLARRDAAGGARQHAARAADLRGGPPAAGGECPGGGAVRPGAGGCRPGRRLRRPGPAAACLRPVRAGAGGHGGDAAPAGGRPDPARPADAAPAGWPAGRGLHRPDAGWRLRHQLHRRHRPRPRRGRCEAARRPAARCARQHAARADAVRPGPPAADREPAGRAGLRHPGRPRPGGRAVRDPGGRAGRGGGIRRGYGGARAVRARCSTLDRSRPARYRRRRADGKRDRGRLRPDAGWRLRRHPYRRDRAGPGAGRGLGPGRACCSSCSTTCGTASRISTATGGWSPPTGWPPSSTASTRR